MGKDQYHRIKNQLKKLEGDLTISNTNLSMQMDNLTFAYLVHEFEPIISGGYINKVSELEDKSLKIKIHTKQGSKDLIITKNSLFISSYSHKARHGKTPFSESLKKHLYNKRIIGVEQHDSDRIILLKFSEYSLVLEFIGEGNKILLDNLGKIVSCQRKEEWADRKIAKGESYKFPKHAGLDPKNISSEEFGKLLASSNKDLIRTIISSVNISPLVAEEILYRLKIEKNKKASSVSESEALLIAENIKKEYNFGSSGAQPCAYKEFCYPFKLMHIAEAPKEIKSLNSFLDEEFANKIANHLENKNEAKKPGKKTSLEFMKLQQIEAKKKFEIQISEAKAKGDLIYSKYNEIDELLKLVQKLAFAKRSEKEIIEEIKKIAEKGNSAAKAFKKLDLKNKLIELEF
jgi:predicted ribosome quality control (RQC) complex YloA/Tae2 family protein